MDLLKTTLYRHGQLSVPDAPCSMMWNGFFPTGFDGLHRLVEEEVYQDCINLCFWVFFLYLSPD